MENSPYSIYCHNPRIPYYRDTCNKSDLIVVKILEEQNNSDKVCTGKVTIHRCRVCGGFYKQEYRATYSEGGWMGDEERWSVKDDYYKIEEPAGDARNCPIPLTLEDARTFGYTGEDFTWANNRCNFNLQNVELTCRMRDLQCVAYRSPELTAHNHDRFYKCRRCGQWYLFKILPIYTEAYLKPTSEHFPLELAQVYGYDKSQEGK